MEVYLQIAKRITKKNTRIPRCVQKIRRKPLKLGRFLIIEYYLYDGTPYILLVFTIHAGYPNRQTDPFSTGRARASQGIRERSRLHLLMLQKSGRMHQLRISMDISSMNIGFYIMHPRWLFGISIKSMNQSL